ncbi:hypothetical protein ACT7CT_21845 [Bacillus sanguinis]
MVLTLSLESSEALAGVSPEFDELFDPKATVMKSIPKHSPVYFNHRLV